MYMLFCFFKLFLVGCIGLMTHTHSQTLQLISPGEVVESEDTIILEDVPIITPNRDVGYRLPSIWQLARPTPAFLKEQSVLG